MSDTPRTDALLTELGIFKETSFQHIVQLVQRHADFSRELERENAKLRRQLETTQQAAKLLDDAIDAMTKLHERLIPNDNEEQNAAVPASAMRGFVDAHATLLYERKRLQDGESALDSRPAMEKAKELMVRATQAMLDCGQYQAVRAIVTRTMVHGQHEDVTCLIFGHSADVLDAVACRVGDTSIDEKIAASLANGVIVRAAGQR